MLSNSVLLMTKPFIESWRVESKMKPYKHYVPLKKDFSDLDEIMNWCLKNDKRWKNQFSFIGPAKNISPSWMGLPIMINEKFKIKRMKFLNYLDKNGIETRPIISGSFTNQPASKLYKLNPRKTIFQNAQTVKELGFLIGLHQNKI